MKKTPYNWFNAWNGSGLIGLYDRPGRGRKSKLNDEQKAQVKVWVQASPRNLKPVLEKIKATWNITISQDTLKRVLKALKMKWRRMRRVTPMPPLSAEYRRKHSALNILKTLDAMGHIRLYSWMKVGLR